MAAYTINSYGFSYNVNPINDEFLIQRVKVEKPGWFS
jgi:hypothetical protein